MQLSWPVCIAWLALSSVSILPFKHRLYLIYARPLAAYFVQSAVSAYEKHIGFNPQDRDEPGKEASNLIVLISELYNFQVVGCTLIYDLVRDLLGQPQLSEHNIELLLKILRSKYHRIPPGRLAELSKILGYSSDTMTHLH